MMMSWHGNTFRFTGLCEGSPVVNGGFLSQRAGYVTVMSHYSDVIMSDGVSNHRRLDCLLNRLFRRRSKKISSSASLDFVREIHRWPVNFSHKGPLTRKMFSFDDVIMKSDVCWHQLFIAQTLQILVICDTMTLICIYCDAIEVINFRW